MRTMTWCFEVAMAVEVSYMGYRRYIDLEGEGMVESGVVLWLDICEG